VRIVLLLGIAIGTPTVRHNPNIFWPGISRFIVPGLIPGENGRLVFRKDFIDTTSAGLGGIGQQGGTRSGDRQGKYTSYFLKIIYMKGQS
jgi:hypothetical protein